MDAVELPLPANVVVSKLLATDGFGRVKDAEGRGLDGVDASVLGRTKDSGCSPRRGDFKHPLSISECSSISRNKKSMLEIHSQKHMLPSFKSEGNSKRHYLGEVDMTTLSMPKDDGKIVTKRSVKKLSSFPCPKKPRIDQVENSLIAETDDRENVSREIGRDLMLCTSSEKSRLVKQKRGHDGKRIDKKNFRAAPKAKYDGFMLKSGLANCDSTFGGNNILGICGLKADMCDATKHMEELSLGELLDGSYRYSSICPDKAKRHSTTNESTLLSVRKVWSILCPPGTVDSSVNRKDAAGILSPNMTSGGDISDCDNKDRGGGEVVSFRKEPFHVNFSNSILSQPQHILDSLALSAGQDLDSLLLGLSMNSAPLQPTTHHTTFCGASLPPFTWSYSHTGAYRSSSDAGKLASTRSSSQCRWVRIRSNYMPVGEAKHAENEDLSGRQKIDNILRDVETMNLSVKDTFNPSCLLSSSEVLSSLSSDSMIGSSFISSHISHVRSITEEHGGSSCNQLKSDSMESSFLRSSESEAMMKFQGNETTFLDSSKSILQAKDFGIAKNEQQMGKKRDCPETSCFYPCESLGAVSGQSCWPVPAKEASKPGHSPRVLRAAAILCEMASCCSGAMKTHKCTSGGMKPFNPPPQKTMKAHKPLSSFDKTDRPFLTARYNDSVRSTVKHKSSERTDHSPHTNISGRGPVRWPVPTEGSASPGKLERDLTVSVRQFHSNTIRPPNLIKSSQARIEKDYDNQQKLRKATLTTSSLAYGGTYIRDWNRARNKRI
ncbi:uncharacterized protein [Typha latifolia]|uniref:uncharacterized protein isoform X1 n=1 Tax=Typha latifolia TaxID=4733 RepID=UPI003C300AE0